MRLEKNKSAKQAAVQKNSGLFFCTFIAEPHHACLQESAVMNGRGRQAALNSLQKQAVEAFKFVVGDAVTGILQGDQAGSADTLMLKIREVARNHHILGAVEDDGGDVDTGEIGPPVLVPEGDRGPDSADPRRGQGHVLKPSLGGL